MAHLSRDPRRTSAASVPDAVLWQRRALLHLHATAVAQAGTDVLPTAHPASVERILEQRGRPCRPGSVRTPRQVSPAEAAKATVLVDDTPLPPAACYRLDPADKPVVGKYVPDPSDPTPQPKQKRPLKSTTQAVVAAYGLTRSASKRSAPSGKPAQSASGRRASSTPGKGDQSKQRLVVRRPTKVADGSDGDDDAPQQDGAEGESDHEPTTPPGFGLGALDPEDLLDVPLIASIFHGVANHPSAGSMWYPIAYPMPPRKKPTVVKRAQPDAINETLHAPWPSAAVAPPKQVFIPPPPGSEAAQATPFDQRVGATATCSEYVSVPELRTLRLKRHNSDFIPLYRIGPGAVAFKVVMNAFEANGSQFTPGGVFDHTSANSANPPGCAGSSARPGSNSTAASFNVVWAKRADPAVFSAMNVYQHINHYPGTWGIGRKDNLHKNVSRMRAVTTPGAFDITPRTFLCPTEMSLLEEDARRYAKANQGQDPTYIVKPVASSCGKGIRVVKGIPRSLREGAAPEDGPQKPYIVQQYLDPFLVDGRKFDLRMYCVVTSFDPLRIYLFDQGLVRFAAERYPGPDALLENSWMHLTNYAVNKTAALRKDGNDPESDEPVDIKWMISDLHDHFLVTTRDAIPEPTADEVEAAVMACGKTPPTPTAVRHAQWASVMRRVKAVVVKTVLSIENDVVEQCRHACRDPSGRGCFELFGFDLMLNSALEPHVIEVNIMPSLATAEEVDKAVKGRLISGITTLIGAVPFSRSAERERREVRPQLPLNEKRYTYSRRFLDEDAAARAGYLARIRPAAGSNGAAPAVPTPAAPPVDDDSPAATDPDDGSDRSGGSGDSDDVRTTSDAEGRAADSGADTPRGAASATSPRCPKPPRTATGNPRKRRLAPSRKSNKPLLNIASPPLLAALRAKGRAPLEHAPLPADSGAHKPSVAEVRMLIEGEEELQRSGGFERIFPTVRSHHEYSHLFSRGLRRSNYVMASWEYTKQIIEAAASSQS